MSSPRFAFIRKADAEQLHRTSKLLEELQEHEGFKWLMALLHEQQRLRAAELRLPPGRDRADTYGLKAAHIGGVLEGMSYAHDAVQEVIEVARDELKARQREVAEQAAREEDQ